ncbi:lipopolysaccharide heptosyltransferase II [Roseimicrobium gellanilyticum]|uniref:lipopolysaccharide heptosyltransferase II n=1 Tax=Roseimicrobium gellanilyticum TaxID=748857 RepID=A0A366HT21_9BACT|nr:lipopolysaccharide heptosyltransferase II [Roseimicrobium gellanilyticum]RBP47423.1 lipopolysaccharide heptosyltransferase II [Roseimicrobium gellanilyticum]
MARTGFGKNISRAGQYLVYLLFRAVEGVLGLMPLMACAFVGRVFGLVAHAFFPSYRKLAQANLRIAFGREKDEAWIRATAREHFASLGQNFLCGLKLPLMSQKDVESRVTVEGMHHADAVAAAGKPLLYAVCHLSCWELFTQVPSLFTSGLVKPASVFQPLGNAFLNEHVKRRREKLGYTLFDRSQGFSGPIQHMRAYKGAMGVLVDQHAGDKGVWCPFFDRLASTSSLAALMSLRVETPLVPIAMYNDGLARWRMVCYPPVNSGEKKTTAEGLTAMLNIAIEIVIRRAPENWFWVHNRWKTPQPDFLLAKYRRGVVLPVGYDINRLQKFNLLVRSPNWLGDACMTLPAIRALKRGRPDLRLTILAPSKLAELWKAIPEVDDIIGKEKGDGIRDVARKVRERGGYDAAILFTNSTRSTLELWHADIPRLVGYRGSLRSRLLHQIVPEPKQVGPPEHHAERYLRLAANCGAKTEDSSLFDVPGGVDAGATKTIGICAGAEYGPAKRWPLERFAEVARRLSATWPDVEWIFFGAPNEKAMGEELSRLLTGVKHTNLVGKTSLSELIAQLRACSLLLTNDTGTMHLAASLGVPTVSIFGSTEPVLTGPLGAQHRVVRYHVPCSPCFRRECPFGHYDCMTKVTPERVERVMREALPEFSQAPQIPPQPQTVM